MNEPKHGGSPQRSFAIDAMKALAAQTIVMHHFCIYGPLGAQASLLAPSVFAFLVGDARLAVQCFLVCAGFLASAKLARRNKPLAMEPLSPEAFSRAIAGRFSRLAPLHYAGIALAIACSWLARMIAPEPTLPDSPTLSQLAAHLFFAQDVYQYPALSAGVWYAAIDLQLFSLAALLALSRAASRPHGASACIVGLAGVSLAFFNLDSNFDASGLYFFGAYALGMIARAAAESKGVQRRIAQGTILALAIVASAIEWRSRIGLAAALALALSMSNDLTLTIPSKLRALANASSDSSFALFVAHYPVLMLVGSLWTLFAPSTPAWSFAGLGLCWICSMGTSNVLVTFDQAIRAARRNKSTTEPKGLPDC